MPTSLPARRSRRATSPIAVATAIALVGAATATATAAPTTTDTTALPAVTVTGDELALTWPTDRVTDVPARAIELEGRTARALDTTDGYQLRFEPRAALDASELDAAAVEGGRLRVRVTDLDGPGELALATAGLKDTRVTTSLDPDAPIDVAAGRATPTTWTVTEAGRYDVTLEIAAARPGGEAIVAESTVSLRVVPEAPAVSPAPRPDATPSTDEAPAPEPQRESEPEAAASTRAATDDADDAERLDTEAVDEDTDDAASTRSQVTGGERLILDRGHVDAFEVSLADDDLVLSLKDDTFLHADQIVYRDPSEVRFHVLPRAATEVPDSPDFDFLGDAGETVYLLPLTQDPELVWPGWSTERLRANQVDGQVQLRITDVSGPGELKIFTSSTFGGNQVLVDSEDGLPDAWNVNVPAHVHANWAFTSTGAYTLTVDASATLADGTDVSTGPVTYHWHVGDLDDDGGNGGGSGDGDGADDAGDGDGADDAGDGDGADDAGDGDGTGAGGDGDGSGSGGRLAHTGTDTTTLVLSSLLLLSLGAHALRRQRRGPAAADA